MSEIKPVYQVQQLGEWIEVEKHIFDELYIQNKFPHRILYPAAAYEALQKENDELRLMINGSVLQIQAMQLQINAMKIGQKVLDGAIQAKSISDSEWREKYMREAEGINNEGDPIGGDPPSGLRHAVEYFKSENAAQAKRIAGLYDVANDHRYSYIAASKALDSQKSEIESLRKQVEILQRPLDDEIISRIVCLVKNIPDEELASNVFESVRNMTNWNKSTPSEFLVLFDQTSASKNGE